MTYMYLIYLKMPYWPMKSLNQKEIGGFKNELPKIAAAWESKQQKKGLHGT